MARPPEPKEERINAFAVSCAFCGARTELILGPRFIRPVCSSCGKGLGALAAPQPGLLLHVRPPDEH
jgi:hypothetical protein